MSYYHMTYNDMWQYIFIFVFVFFIYGWFLQQYIYTVCVIPVSHVLCCSSTVGHNDAFIMLSAEVLGAQ